jgi:hypothetical protein
MSSSKELITKVAATRYVYETEYAKKNTRDWKTPQGRQNTKG